MVCHTSAALSAEGLNGAIGACMCVCPYQSLRVPLYININVCVCVRVDSCLGWCRHWMVRLLRASVYIAMNARVSLYTRLHVCACVCVCVQQPWVLRSWIARMAPECVFAHTYTNVTNNNQNGPHRDDVTHQKKATHYSCQILQLRCLVMCLFASVYV